MTVAKPQMWSVYHLWRSGQRDAHTGKLALMGLVPARYRADLDPDWASASGLGVDPGRRNRLKPREADDRRLKPWASKRGARDAK